MTGVWCLLEGRDRALQEAPDASRKSACPTFTVPYCHRAHQEAPGADRKSACPAVTVPSKRPQTPLANQARPLLDAPYPVDRCCSCTALLVSTMRTAALPWRGPDHCPRKCSLTHCQGRRTSLLPSSSTSQYFGCQRNRHRNILIAVTKRSHSVDTVNLVTHRGICDTLLAHSHTLICAVERESSTQPLFSCGPSATLSCLIDIVSWLSAFCTSL